jgi:hypothetical protein
MSTFRSWSCQSSVQTVMTDGSQKTRSRKFCLGKPDGTVPMQERCSEFLMGNRQHRAIDKFLKPRLRLKKTFHDAKVAKLVDCLNDGLLEEEEEEDLPRNVAISKQVLVESAAWAGEVLHQSRAATGPVTTDSEKRFFADNCIQFLKMADDTKATNHSVFS